MKKIKSTKLTANDIQPASEKMIEKQERFYEELANKIAKWLSKKTVGL